MVSTAAAREDAAWLLHAHVSDTPPARRERIKRTIRVPDPVYDIG
jgi:hypothetical protein